MPGGTAGAREQTLRVGGEWKFHWNPFLCREEGWWPSSLLRPFPSPFPHPLHPFSLFPPLFSFTFSHSSFFTFASSSPLPQSTPFSLSPHQMAAIGDGSGQPASSSCCSSSLPLASPQSAQRHSSRHTIHPKLSLSAKRSTASMTAGAGPQQNGGGASTSFQLTLSFSNAENGAPITFKQDGSRFKTSQRTLKLQSNCKYKVTVKTKSAQDFLSLHIGGSDLELANGEGGHGSGEYTATWNTTGIDPSKKGGRQDILFLLSGPGKTLSHKLQTKFYGRQDSHAAMGHRLDALVWRCELDPIGQVQVRDEKLL